MGLFGILKAHLKIRLPRHSKKPLNRFLDEIGALLIGLREKVAQKLSAQI